MNPAPTPIQLEFQKSTGQGLTRITTFDSYSFDRSLTIPASPFRFTAPGVDKATRTQVRSGDRVTIVAVQADGSKVPIGTGFIDETDTHVSSGHLEYVLSGRDTLGQLVDNAAVDAQNKVVFFKNLAIGKALELLLQGTRIQSKPIVRKSCPNGLLIFNTVPGETKINALQRYLELVNCLVWTSPQGQVIIGQPNFHNTRQGNLICSSSDPKQNNVIEARSKRNLNQAIRQIVTQLQGLENVYAAPYTKNNNDPDMLKVAKSLVGRSVFTLFSYAQGEALSNQLKTIGTEKAGDPKTIGAAYSLREIAKDNMKVLAVDVVVRGHLNELGQPYNVDQIYNVQIEDDDVAEDMMVHQVSYELTMEHGMLTRMQLTRMYTMVAETAPIGK